MLYLNGNDLIARKQLNLIPVTSRENPSPRWQGIQHGKLATAIVKQAKAEGLEVLKEQWYVNKSKSDLFGAVDFSLESLQNCGLTLDIGQAATFSLGVRHSNAGTYTVSFAVGGRVAVCQNGMFTGDFTLKHRHTAGLDVDALVSEGITQYIDQAGRLELFVNRLRDADISEGDAADFIFRSSEGQGGFVNFQHLEGVYSNWHKPPHEEFEPRTAWSLYNAYTEMSKKLSPLRQVKLLRGLKRMLLEEFVSEPEQEVLVRTT